MKICLVLASVGEGGLEGHVATLANSLAAEPGVEVVVVAPAFFADKLGDRVLFTPVNLTCNRRNPFVLWKLLQAIRQHAPDIVHAHANKAAAMVAAVRRFYPGCYVATVHGSKRQTGVYGRFDHVIAVSKDVAATLPNVPATVIYNGVRAPEGQQSRTREQLAVELGIASSRQLVVAVGRQAPVKGYDLLLQAWQDVDAELLLVGDGPERLRLQTLSEELGLKERVHFLGFRRDAVAIMTGSDLVVLSSHREGFPLVLVEALQAGTPVVSTDVSGAREILPPEMLVPVGDATALACGINRALSLPAEELHSLFHDSFRVAREELTLEKQVAHTLNLFRSMVTS